MLPKGLVLCALVLAACTAPVWAQQEAGSPPAGPVKPVAQAQAAAEKAGAQAAAQPEGEAAKAPAPQGFQESADLVERATRLQQRFEAQREEALAENLVGYDPAGRRDPFRPLVGVQVEQEERGKLPGIAGLHWEELTLIGIVEAADGPMAIFFGGTEQEGYFVREGMNFYNGSIQKIDPVTSMVTIRQKIEDRNQLKPYRDIPISLHPPEEGGEEGQ